MRGLAHLSRASAGFHPRVLPGIKWLVQTDKITIDDTKSGTGGSFVKSGSSITFTPTVPPSFTQLENDQFVVITGSTTPGNNGNFLVVSVTATALIYTNAAGATEAFPGTWATQGRAASLVDEIAAYSFARATNTERPGVATHLKPGHKILTFCGSGTASYRKLLVCTDATLAGALNGSPACTFGIYWNPTYSGTLQDLIAHTSSSVSYSATTAFRVISPTGTRVRDVASGLTTNYSFTTQPAAVWKLMCVTLDGAGNATFYENGVQVATASGTDRNPLGMVEVVIGESSATNAVRQIFVGGAFVCTGQLSTQLQSTTKLWYDNSFL